MLNKKTNRAIIFVSLAPTEKATEQAGGIWINTIKHFQLLPVLMRATPHPHPAVPRVDLQSLTAVIHSDCRSEQKHLKNSNKKNGRLQILKTTCLQECDGLL